MSATLAVHNEVRRLRAAGETVFHLGFGEATFPVHPKILEAFQRHATERTYLPVAGLPELRERVAGYYRRRFGIEAEASRVLVGCGSKSLLYAALRALDGDVVLTDACWVTYAPQARLAGIGIHVAETRLEDDYCLTPEGLERTVREARAAGGRPAAVVLSSPNNPTGVMMSPELIGSLTKVARAEDLLVISDEIYALTAYGEVPHRSVACDYPEGTIVTGGLSKHLSLGGWRLGVAVLPTGELGERLSRSMCAIGGSVWTTATAPVQYAALAAYADDPEIDDYIAACATLHGRMTRYLYRRLARQGVPCPEPDGAFYLFPSFSPWSEALRARHGVETCGDLCRVLLAASRIAALPGADFGAEPAALAVRLSSSQLHGLANAGVERVLELAGADLPDDAFCREVAPDLPQVGERLANFINTLGKARMAS